MKNILHIVICATVIFLNHGYALSEDTFPAGFMFGTATSSYQIEGAWNVSDKGLSDWDHYVHTCPSCITDHSTGDVACNSYYKYKEDVALVKNIGFNFYRFSISWPRIIPNGYTNKVSQDGIRYYHNLIDEILANGIEPFVTIYHFDHPYFLEEMGGWMNEMMIDRYVEYARLIFKEFGSKVKHFVTINEPQQLCVGYLENSMPPAKELLEIGIWRCQTNVLKAHARAYHMYDAEFRTSQHGQIGMTFPCEGMISFDDVQAAAGDTAFQFGCGMMAHPIYVGDFPPKVKTRIAKMSKMQGYPKSRLPELSPEWIAYIKGTCDYFGLNHYTSTISIPDPDEALGIYKNDLGYLSVFDPSWASSSASWLKVVPRGFRNVLCKIKDEYNNPLVYVLENGYPDYGELNDYERIRYFQSYLKELLIAIKEDGCRVSRYTVWSLLDNFQLNAGYTQPFGIVKVDFDDPERNRTEKLSANWWRETIRTRKLRDNDDGR
ncbi:myrosinase 1-like [Athalia rosae]|uniref:myrosinase 1-like n=1 Tax=Athalia rosae TaxID=37344 RepID=UPI002034946F|nr:myrosinase 1-like [Athalia rosae]